jgi:hypothetical protein
MVLDKKVKVEISYANYMRYVKIGVIKKEDFKGVKKTISVPIKKLGLCARVFVNFKCDYCNIEYVERYDKRNSKCKTSPIKKDSCGSKECSLAKYKESNMKKYGAEFPLNAKGTEPNKKYKETMLEKYGYEFNCIRPEVKKKALDNYMNNFSDVLEKREKTCLEKFGTKHAFQNEDVKDKIKVTNNIRYGGDNPSQNIDVHIKQQKSCLNMYNYKDTNLTYQGTYELDFIEYCYANNIKIENGQRIPYIFDGKNKKYYADFYLPKYNLIVEVKSIWTYNLAVDQNEAKKQICLDNGYLFLFLIDKNYIEFENFLKIIDINKK